MQCPQGKDLNRTITTTKSTTTTLLKKKNVPDFCKVNTKSHDREEKAPLFNALFPVNEVNHNPSATQPLWRRQYNHYIESTISFWYIYIYIYIYIYVRVCVCVCQDSWTIRISIRQLKQRLYKVSELVLLQNILHTKLQKTTWGQDYWRNKGKQSTFFFF